MEGIALKLAGEAAVPAATYVYETLKNQTGRAKFEKGKANLQDGFALLRDGKAGGLLPARERVELLQTHAELVANRENVEEITHTLYGSLAHRHTAKEFESRAKQFRKNVETPAEKAQMEYELRKAKLEMAAERSPSSKDPHISQNQRDASASKFSPVDAHLKPAVGLSRSPTTIDYPISSQSRQIPNSIVIAALSDSPGSNMERPNDHHAGSLPTINASKSRETHAQRFRSNTRPLPTREATYPPVSRRANQTQDIGSLHNNLKPARPLRLVAHISSTFSA
ncbi:hypothetical protein DFH07DRAFT_969809 [Mycena maculata]|uniref:Uncharacterized protein n=1 Tax=Mycena maculata TaxID=230809 RepID=A0AAD7HUC9_9AGAR|nr:hypothetical protein DFH07DRAFT_969809 [Mycena maculata]